MTGTDFLSYSKKGLYCSAGDFYLDSLKPVSVAVISHAHADHAVRGNGEVYCTTPTADFMKECYREKAAQKFNLIRSFDSFSINDVQLKFIPAGHMLGSVQVLMEYKNVKYLYTGDFKLQHDETCEPFQFTETDVLITESTFAEPGFFHPDAEKEIEKLVALNKPIVIGAYSLGKAQRLTQLISKLSPQKEIFIHRNIYPFHKIYEQNNIKLGNWKPYSAQLFKRLKHCVYIVPPKVFHSFYAKKDQHLAFATGWNHLQKNCDLNLMISDHADWNDLLTLIEKTKPKKILTLHGNGQSLRKYFTGSEIEVQILN